MDLSGSWQYIEETARGRLAHNKTRRHVSHFGEGIEVIGVAGELLVRRFLGLDEQVHTGFDRGVDIHYYGMRIDVKATVLTPNATYRFLQWPYWKQIIADTIVMTVVDPIHQYGTVIGYVTRDEIASAPINQTRYTPCHEIPFTELHPAWKLIVEGCRARTMEAGPRVQFPAQETGRGALLTPAQSQKPAAGTEYASRGLSSKMGA